MCSLQLQHKKDVIPEGQSFFCQQLFNRLNDFKLKEFDHLPLGITHFIGWKVNASLCLDQYYRSLQWPLPGKCETERKCVCVCVCVQV